jgi:DNA invertase Pin-like site-specific DNA recombinase
MAAKKKKKEERTVRNVAYLRVSSPDQNTEKNKHDILSFCNDRGFVPVKFIEEVGSGKISWKNRKVKQIIEELGKDDRLIVPELSRLGRSLLDIMQLLAEAKEKEICIYDVKNKIELNGTFQGELMAMIFGIAAQIERDLISARTKEGLANARSKGRILGRPRGPGKSKLDPFKPEIIALLNNGSTRVFVSKRYHTTCTNLYNWLIKNKIKIKPQVD